MSSLYSVVLAFPFRALLETKSEVFLHSLNAGCTYEMVWHHISAWWQGLLDTKYAHVALCVHWASCGCYWPNSHEHASIYKAVLQRTCRQEGRKRNEQKNLKYFGLSTQHKRKAMQHFDMVINLFSHMSFFPCSLYSLRLCFFRYPSFACGLPGRRISSDPIYLAC